MPNFGPFQPLNGRLIIKRTEEAAESLVKVSSKYVEESNEGQVVYISPEATEAGIRVGDHVLFGKYNADEYEENGEKLLIVRLGDLRGFKPLIKE